MLSVLLTFYNKDVIYNDIYDIMQNQTHQQDIYSYLVILVHCWYNTLYIYMYKPDNLCIIIVISANEFFEFASIKIKYQVGVVWMLMTYMVIAIVLHHSNYVLYTI